MDYSAFESAAGLNWYDCDPNLQGLMRRLLDPADLPWCEDWLRRWGALCGGAVAERAEVTDRNPPHLVKYDRWGNEIDEVVHHPTATETKKDLWNTGFNGLPWSDAARERGRPVPALLMTAYTYFLSQAETGMLCAMGMTSGVADLVEKYADDRVKAEFLPHLRAMSHDEGWDGAMFLTERTGGSDLGALTTTATRKGDHWVLNGLKWFCSNVDARAIVTLARPTGAPEGIKGIGIFLVPKYRRDGTRNGIHIRRIKDKLGTRAVPTAEVDFVDAEAFALQGTARHPADHGINRMMEMVNFSRVGVGVMGAGIARRTFLEAAIYASKREAFGRPLLDWPMMRQDLLRIQIESEASTAMVFECARAAEQVRARADEDAARYLRILSPLTKMAATRQGLQCASRALEVVAGNGYIEDWPLARQFRDAQCHTIWEGTDNILALDALRGVAKYRAHEALLDRIDSIVKKTSHPSLETARRNVAAATEVARKLLTDLASGPMQKAIGSAKQVAFLLGSSLQGALFIEEAAHEIRSSTSLRKAVVADAYASEYLAGGRVSSLPDHPAANELFAAVFSYDKIPQK